MSDRRPREIGDLGLAAYLKMHGHKVSQIKPRQVWFDVPDAKTAYEIDDLIVKYVNSEESTFDGWIMTLKRMPIAGIDEENFNVIVVTGIGLSAWIRMKGNWRIVGRKNHVDYGFFVPTSELTAFESLQIAWTNNPLRDFEASMMAIKNVRTRNK